MKISQDQAKQLKMEILDYLQSMMGEAAASKFKREDSEGGEYHREEDMEDDYESPKREMMEKMMEGKKEMMEDEEMPEDEGSIRVMATGDAAEELKKRLQKTLGKGM